VAPRLIALVVMAPLLTVVCDMVGTLGGMLSSIAFLHQPASVYLASAQKAVSINEIISGLIKPTVFGYLIAVIGCYKGLSTTGGTVGVGRATTQSVVVSSILIIAVDFLLSKLILSTLLAP
jgi:phospholipid/cholesterol/gamma-HCH transport system permease protein